MEEAFRLLPEDGPASSLGVPPTGKLKLMALGSTEQNLGSRRRGESSAGAATASTAVQRDHSLLVVARLGRRRGSERDPCDVDSNSSDLAPVAELMYRSQGLIEVERLRLITLDQQMLEDQAVAAQMKLSQQVIELEEAHRAVEDWRIPPTEYSGSEIDETDLFDPSRRDGQDDRP